MSWLNVVRYYYFQRNGSVEALIEKKIKQLNLTETITVGERRLQECNQVCGPLYALFDTHLKTQKAIWPTGLLPYNILNNYPELKAKEDLLHNDMHRTLKYNRMTLYNEAKTLIQLRFIFKHV